MRTPTKLALFAVMITATSLLSARGQSEPNDLPPSGSPQGGGAPRARFGQALTQTIDRYDVNHDGQLDQTEMTALQKDVADGKVQPPGPPPGRGRDRMPGGPGGQGDLSGPGTGPGLGQRLPPAVLERYDLNKDGHLDETERAALHQDVQDGKLPLPQAGRGPRHEGRRPSAQAILDRFDADHDGKLDATELAAFLNAPAPRPPHPPLGPDAPEPRGGQPGQQ